MATDKKSVLLYCDLIHTVEKMDNETAGEFFKHLLRYINDLNPKTDNLVVDISFEAVKQTLKRDLKKWGETKDSKSLSGQEGNLKRWHPDIYKDYKDGKQTLNESQVIAKGRKAIKPIANIAVNVTDSVTVTETVNVKDIKNNNTPIKIGGVSIVNLKNEEFENFWNYYDKKVNKMKTLKKWVKLSKDDIAGIKATIKDYIKSTPDKNFRKDPLTYLNNEAWNDEIINFNKTNNGNKQLTATEKNQRDSNESTKRMLEQLQKDIDNQQGI